MVNHFEVIAQIVDLFIVTPNYQLKDNSGVTEILKNYTMAGNYKANNFKNAKCENGVRLIGLLVCFFIIYFDP